LNTNFPRPLYDDWLTRHRLLGIEPDAPHHSIATLGRLPAEVTWPQLDHVPLGSYDLLVRQDNQNRTTTLRNNTGPAGLKWEARFSGSFATLLVDGAVRKAKHRVLNGVGISYTEVRLAGGQQATVATGPTL
jgi:hypothetical protein